MVCKLVKLSKLEAGICWILFYDKLSSTRLVRLPISLSMCVKLLLSRRSTLRFVRALIYGLIVVNLLLLKSNFSRLGKFKQKSSSISSILLPYSSSILRR